MTFKFDGFDRYHIPVLVLENPNFTQIATIKPSKEPKFTLRFNAISEMEFEINERNENGDRIPYYDSIVKNKVIHTNEFGDWIVNTTNRENTGTCEKKTVNCYSYEYTLSIKDANIDAGTYKFYSATPSIEKSTPLLNLIMSRLPGWELGHVSSDLMNKYRTFDMPDGSLYAFMTEDMAEAYEVFFTFDYAYVYSGEDTGNYVGGHWKHILNAYTKDELVSSRATDVVLRWNNLLKNVKIEETDDGIVTALSVYGAGDFSIDTINPWGTTLYDFSYYGKGHGKGASDDPDYVVEITKLQHFLNISTYALNSIPPKSVQENGKLNSATISLLQGWLNSLNDSTNIEITGIIDYETRNAIRQAIERGLLDNVYRGILTEGWMTAGLWEKVSEWQAAVERETKSTDSTHFPAYVKRKREITDILLEYAVEQATVQSYLDASQAIIDARLEAIASGELTSGTISDTSAAIIEALKENWLYNGNFDPHRTFVGSDSLFQKMYPLIDKYFAGHYSQYQFLWQINKQVGNVANELSMYMFETLRFIINGDYSGYDSSELSLPITLVNPPEVFNSALPSIFPTTVIVNGTTYDIAKWFGTDGDGYGDCSYADACINLYMCQAIQNYLTNFLVYGYSLLSDEATRLINIQSSKWQINYDGTSVEGSTFHFTEDEQAELDKYIYGSTYTNEYYVVTDQMSYAEQNDLARELYDQAKNVMAQMSQPTYTFSLESINFLFSKEYKHYTDQLQLGSTVHAEIKEADWVTPILLELSFDFSSPDDFSMTFGNRYRLQTSEYTFSDLYDQVTKTSGTVNKDFHDIITPTRSGQISEMNEFINSMLDTSKNKVLAGTNQSIIIDEHGLIGRKSLSSGTSSDEPDCKELLYEDEQIRLINNLLCFTDDGWRTVKTALGKITLNDGTSTWGLVGESVYGKLLAGGQLIIQSDDNAFIVDGDGVAITNSKFVSYSAATENASKVKITIDPTDDKYAFAIYSRTATGNASWGVPKLYADNSGNIVIDSSLTSIAKVGGWTNGANSLGYTGSTFYAKLGSGSSNVTAASCAFSAGTYDNTTKKEVAKFSVSYGGKLVANDAVITGDITATKATFKDVKITGTGSTWTGGTFENITCQNINATSGAFTNCSFSGTLSGATGTFTNLSGTGKVKLGSSVTIDTYGLTLLGATNAVRFFMNPPTATGGTEARWVARGGYYSLGVYTSTRDSKKDIELIGDECSNIIDNLKPVYFRFKEQSAESNKSVGFIAEETDEACKEITSYSEDGAPVGVQYSNITALLTAEIQSLRKRVRALERKLYL